MTEMLRISTLGNLSISYGNNPVTGFVSRKAEALLVYVVCHPGEHLRESLAAFFWEDLAQEQAMANFRVVLSNLRQLFSEHLLSNRQSLQVNPDSDNWIDLNDLRIELSAIERLLKSEGALSVSASEHLLSVLELYRGDFLAGFHVRDCKQFEDWKLFEQEHIRTRVSGALQHLVTYYLTQEEYTSGINIAQRLLQIDPLSETAHHDLMFMLLQNSQRNAALAQYESYRAMLINELGVEPSDRIKELYYNIQTAKPVQPRSPRRIRLPIPSTPLINREIELTHISAYLSRSDCRLLTLTGLGGIGKTRLAIEAASQNQFFQDGIYFVPFAAVASADLVIPVLASALKIALQESAPPEVSLIDALDNKEMLIVLDNLDHLAKDISVLGDILTNIRGIKFLVTSRQQLNLREEWVLPIKELAVPAKAEIDHADQYAAVQLFEYSAQRASNEFSLSDNLSAVIDICRFVEGLPLGIEMAATWVQILTCDQILEHLQENMEILAASAQNLPERHRNITRLFDYSWTLLSETEREVLMRLSIFANGFSKEAALAVAGASLNLLASLSQKSFINRESANRYTIHKLLQRYIGAKLVESGQKKETILRFCEYFAERAEQIYRTESHKRFSVDSFDAEFFDMQRAMGWALDYSQTAIAKQLINIVVFFWKQRGYMRKYKR